MLTLCKLYGVSSNNYQIEAIGKKLDETFEREIDFYLKDENNIYKCEVKLMGKGNPESADAVIARDSKVFIADKLSDTNKNQLDSLNIEWVELRNIDGYKRFKNVLDNLNIPYNRDGSYTNSELDTIFSEIF